jgi:hypothetical protein
MGRVSPAPSPEGLAATSADGVGHGNGGDGDEPSFHGIQNELCLWIAKYEMKQLDTVPFERAVLSIAVIEAMEKAKVVFTNDLILVGGEERTCAAYRDSQSIRCNKPRYKSERGVPQYKTTFHEYLVLAGAEHDEVGSQFPISGQIGPYVGEETVFVLKEEKVPKVVEGPRGISCEGTYRETDTSWNPKRRRDLEVLFTEQFTYVAEIRGPRFWNQIQEIQSQSLDLETRAGQILQNIGESIEIA